MSYAVTEINVPALSINDGTDFTFNNSTMRNDSWTEQEPAYLRMMNNTGRGFLVGMKTSGDTFWMRPGECILVPLAPNEVGFSIICKYILSTNSANDFFLCTYFSNREQVTAIEENSQAPPIIHSGLAETSTGTIEAGVPTSEKANAVSTTGLNINQVRYVWMKVEYSIIINAHQFEVTTAPASNANVRIGLYRADSSCQPIDTIIYDSGNIPVASGFLGIKKTSGLSIGIPAAIYLVAINIDVAMSLRAINCGTPAIDTNLGANALIQKVVANQTFGAFPTTGTLWTTTNTGSSGMQHSVVWQWTE